VSETIKRAVNSLGEQDNLKRFSLIYSLFGEEESRKLLQKEEPVDRIQPLKYWYDLLGSKDRQDIESMMALDCRLNLADDLLLYGDKISMASSLEMRVPLLDLELMRLVESLPAKYRLRLGKGKYLHKKVARRYLPPEIVSQRKQAFLKAPVSRWFKKDLKNQVKEVLLAKNSVLEEYLNYQYLEKLINKHISGTHSYHRQLFSLMCLHYWAEEFME